jgi:hypothetical protein
MIEIRKIAVSFDESELLELERIIKDADDKEALNFLKKSIYNRIFPSQQGRLKSHLDAPNPVEGFSQHNKQQHLHNGHLKEQEA